jgi:integrase
LSTKAKLTDTIVANAALPAGKAEAVLWDTDVTGFGLRLRGNSKTYIVAYRPAGMGRSATMRRVKLGTPESIKSAAAARKLAFAMLGSVAGGADPATQRREEKRREKSKVSDLLDSYESDLKRRRYVRTNVVMSVLRRRLKKFANADIADLKGSDFAGVAESLERDNLPGAATEFRARCKAFLAFCHQKRKVIDANPLYGYRKERATRADRLAKETSGRALSDDDLVAIWLAADPATVFGRYVRFLIITGCRRAEGAGLLWSMIHDVDPHREIVLPALFVKSGRPHIVPVRPALAAILGACARDARSDYVFPAHRTGGPMSGWNRLKGKLVKASGVDFAFHDLRRTFRTGLSRLGVETDTAELALGHARSVLLEIYDKDGGADRVRDAFEQWAKHVVVIVERKQLAGADEGVFA